MQKTIIRKTLLYTLLATSLLIVGYLVHHSLNLSNNANLSFDLLQVYLFFFIASIVIYGLSELVNVIDPNKTGYAFLAMTMIKLGFFILLFYDKILATEVLTKSSKIGIIAPLFLFLFLESIAVFRFLNKQ